MIPIYYCTWYFLLFRTNCPSTYHQLEHVFRRWGCHLKASDLFMGQVVSSWKIKNPVIFPFPSQNSQWFLVCCLCPQSPVRTAFQAIPAPFPEVLRGRWWHSCCSLAHTPGPVSRRQKQCGDRPLLQKLWLQGIPQELLQLQAPKSHSRDILCSFLLQDSEFGDPRQVWAASQQTGKSSMQSQNYRRDPAVPSHPTLPFFYTSGTNSPLSLKNPPYAPAWIACNDPLRHALLLEMQTWSSDSAQPDEAQKMLPQMFVCLFVPPKKMYGGNLLQSRWLE